MDMRGLSHFIRDIRETTGNKKMEEQRVKNELAKIKEKFVDDSQMSLYDRKKYVCKLMFITMLGYPVEFGHLEGLKLMAEEAPSEKLIGYLSISVLLQHNSPIIALSTHTIHRDLLSGVEFNVGLALTAISNIGNNIFLENMHNGVQQIALKGECNLETLKKCILALLCIFRKYPGIVDLPLISEKILDYLDSSSSSLVMACVSFMLGSVSSETQSLFSTAVPKLLRIFAQTIDDKKADPYNMYYGVPNPWLQAKILALLRFLDPPTDPVELLFINESLRRALQSTDKVLTEAQTQQKQRGTSNRVNVMISIFVEVFSLIVIWELDMTLMKEAINIVERFIVNKKKANVRYIGLALLSRLKVLKLPDFDYFALCQQFEQQVVVALHESDLSLRLKALNVLVSMCHNSNAPEIVRELLSYLCLGHNPLFREKLFCCIAYLAEKYFERGSSQYIDVMFAAITDAGDSSHPVVVQSVIHTVVNSPNVQKRAATMAFRALAQKRFSNDALIKLSGFLLGEYGCQIALNPESSPLKQIQVIRAQMAFAAETTQGVLLHALLKLFSAFENSELREKVLKIFRKCTRNSSLQIRQWSREYLSLIDNSSVSLLSCLVEPMPPFTAEQSEIISSLISRSGGMWLAGPSHSAPLSLPPVEGIAMTTSPQEIIPLKALHDQYQKSSKTPSSVIDQMNALQPSFSDEEVTAKNNALSRTNAEIFRNACKGESQLIFQDDFIEISWKQNFFYADARVTLTVAQRRDLFGESTTIENSEVCIAAVDAGLLVEMRLIGSSPYNFPKPLPFSVELAARSVYPFSWSPSIRVAYTVRKDSYVRIIMLPLVTTQFIVPYDFHTMNGNSSNSLTLEEVREKIKGKVKLPLTTSVLCRNEVHLTEEFLGGVLKKLGYTVEKTSSMPMNRDLLVENQRKRKNPVVGIGAHCCCTPASVVQHHPVIIEFQLSSSVNEVQVTIFSSNECLQDAILSSIKLHLCT